MNVEADIKYTYADEHLQYKACVLRRYIPVGLLERLPQKINERPSPYVGRDDLETMMASPLASDWVKIR